MVSRWFPSGIHRHLDRLHCPRGWILLPWRCGRHVQYAGCLEILGEFTYYIHTPLVTPKSDRLLGRHRYWR
jgi:hypothetical protein